MQDFSWIQSLPKVCLHDHLDGGLQTATIIEISEEIGHELPETDPEKLQEWFNEAANSHSLVRYLETFSHTTAVMQREQDLRRVAFEHVMTLAADGVIYGEVRWAPELHTEGGLTMQQAIDAVSAGFMDGMEYVAERGGRILVNQLLCGMRQNDNALEVVKLAVANRGQGVVGFDLAGPEKEFPNHLHQEAIDYAVENFLPITLHAGEADGIESVRHAVVHGHALRLGHGVQLTDDFSFKKLGEINPQASGEEAEREVLNLGQLSSWVKDRRITLEVCPCSNLQTDAAQAASDIGRGAESRTPARIMDEHPVALLHAAGFAVTLNPDNRLMSATSVTREFTELARTFGYGPAEFFELTINAIEGAFISLDEKQLLMRSIQGPYSKVMNEQAETDA